MKKYSIRIIWLHWISSLLIIGLAISGIMMEDAKDLSFKLTLYQFHFVSGISVFLLTILRVFAFFRDARPATLYPQKSNRQKLISFVHRGFYWVILWMCISGIISLFVQNIWQSAIYNDHSLMPDVRNNMTAIMLSHHIVAKIVFLLFFLHVFGVFSHIIQTKNNIFKRII
jgi:cytochrome b561